MITGRQIREARKLLGWQPRQLADRAGLRPETLERAESVEGEAPITIARAAKIREAFEAAGVEFLPLGGEGPVVKLALSSHPNL